MNKFERIILVGIIFSAILGMFSTFISDYIRTNYPNAPIVLSFIFLAFLIIGVLSFLYRKIANYITTGMYAVEVFILDSSNKLLLVNHPFHHQFIPPGGRVGKFEFPNDALKKRLRDRIGLKEEDYFFDPKIHEAHNKQTIGHTQKITEPFIVQKEKRRQRYLVKFHYDFIYVARIKNDNFDFLDNDYSPRWVDLNELDILTQQNKTFSDVIETYKLILSKYHD